VKPRRIAMLSVHTSPLELPGTGDAGGMNVYIVELSKQLAAQGTEVEIFTRATNGCLPPQVELAPGVLVRHVTAGPYEGLSKEDLPGQLCAFTSGVLRTEAFHDPGHYDLIHSHYWLSGQVGWLAKERWGVPLVHSMHTLAKVKNNALAGGDSPEPAARLIGEDQVVAAADRLIANTDQEAEQLIRLYDAPVDRVPGGAPRRQPRPLLPGRPVRGPADARPAAGRSAADVRRAHPAAQGPGRAAAHRRRAAAPRSARYADLVVAIVGGPSGNGKATPHHLTRLAKRLGIARHVRFIPPVDQDRLAEYFRAADLVVVPSYNESFGLVAIEAQACGTPVVAANVGGLGTAVRHGESGLLVVGHDPADYAAACAQLLENPERLACMGAAARRHAGEFGWGQTAKLTLDVYEDAITERWPSRRRVSSLA
jgi:D-inositol-3-phosphate glycosyltransferase